MNTIIFCSTLCFFKCEAISRKKDLRVSDVKIQCNNSKIKQKAADKFSYLYYYISSFYRKPIAAEVIFELFLRALIFFQELVPVMVVKYLCLITFYLILTSILTMKRFLTLLSICMISASLLFQSCKDETSAPPKASIFYSVAVRQVAFTALTKRVVKWNWDFGDGKTSTEKDPVHVYEGGGYYTVSLTATGEDGSTVGSEVTIAVDLTPYVLLTGGAGNAAGKTWKLTSTHSSFDKLANADADLTPVDGAPAPLPSGVFGMIGLSEVYDDTFTFHYDGSYSHDVKADGASFAGIVFEYVTTGGAGIVNAGGVDFGLCTGMYTPENNATFTYVEKEDLVVPSVYGPEGALVFKDVSTLDFSGTEFIGFMDNQRKVIIQRITDTSLRLVMFMAASPDYYPLNTNALVLTFEVVN
jgi:hypothetical protein